MSNYYDSLGQDLAPQMGYPPIDQTPPQGPPMPPPMPPSQGGGAPMPPPMNPTTGLDPFSKAQIDAAQALNPSPAQQGPGMPGPGVGPNNPMQPGGRPPMPPQMGGGPPGGPQGPGGPMPPPMPGMTSGAGGPSVPFGPSTDWATATGLAPTTQDRMTSALGGLGKGLSAAATNKNSAGNAFMKGASGAITGQINEAQEQQKLKLGLRNAYFSQTSQALKDWQTQKSTDTKDLYWQARAQQYLASAKAGVKQPYNADQLNLARAEDEARKNWASDKNDIMDQAKAGVLTMDDAAKQMAAVQAKKGQYWNDAYKHYGVDPDKAENIRTQGGTVEKQFNDVKNGDWYIDPSGKAIKKTAGDHTYGPADTVKWVNPFDASKMDLTGFHQSVPNGAYYTTPAGLHQRTIPPPAAPDPAGLQQSIQRAEQEENYTGGPQ